MSYKGKFRPSNYTKYKGDPTNIIYRSLWELKFMNWCDRNENILEWGSVVIAITYISQLDGMVNSYFPDFYISIRNKSGRTQKFIVEVKPHKQTMEPKRPKKNTKRYLTESATYAVNIAKWKAATEFCKDRLWNFKIITEKELGL